MITRAHTDEEHLQLVNRSIDDMNKRMEQGWDRDFVASAGIAAAAAFCVFNLSVTYGRWLTEDEIRIAASHFADRLREFQEKDKKRGFVP